MVYVLRNTYLKKLKVVRCLSRDFTVFPPVEFEGTFKEAADVIAITNLTLTLLPEEEPQCGMKYIKEVLAGCEEIQQPTI